MRLSGPAHGGASGERRAVDLTNLVEEALNLADHGARAQDQNFNIALERDLDHNAQTIDQCLPDLPDGARIGLDTAPSQGARSGKARPSRMGCAWPNLACTRT